MRSSYSSMKNNIYIVLPAARHRCGRFAWYVL